MSHHAISILKCDHQGCRETLEIRGGDVYSARIKARRAGWYNRWGTPSNRRGHDLCPEHAPAHAEGEK